MNMTANGLKCLKSWEGLRTKLYVDACGKLTIGYGHRVYPKDLTLFKDGIDLPTAERYLKIDVTAVIHGIKVIEGKIPAGSCTDTIISFVFNIGVPAFLNSTLFRDIMSGNLADIPAQLMRWVHDDHGNVIDGLKHRRQEEIALWKEGLQEAGIRK